MCNIIDDCEIMAMMIVYSGLRLYSPLPSPLCQTFSLEMRIGLFHVLVAEVVSYVEIASFHSFVFVLYLFFGYFMLTLASIYVEDRDKNGVAPYISWQILNSFLSFFICEVAFF